MESFQCIICGNPVDECVDVSIFINPPDGSWEREQSTPYMLSISPCCGERTCCEAAWDQVIRSSIGKIELSKYTEAEEEDN